MGGRIWYERMVEPQELVCAFCRRPASHMALGFTLCDASAEVGGKNCMDRARELFRLNVQEALR